MDKITGYIWSAAFQALALALLLWGVKLVVSHSVEIMKIVGLHG